MPISLKRMTSNEFEKQIQKSIQIYAEHMLKQQEHQTIKSALAAAKAEVFPYYQQIESEKVFSYHIYNEKQNKIGAIVYSHIPDNETGQTIAFIDFISIDENHRRQGFAQQTMKLIEAEVTQTGIEIIALNVMIYKNDARNLYLNLGMLLRIFLVLRLSI